MYLLRRAEKLGKYESRGSLTGEKQGSVECQLRAGAFTYVNPQNRPKRKNYFAWVSKRSTNLPNITR
jgi:hypothetical protein